MICKNKPCVPVLPTSTQLSEEKGITPRPHTSKIRKGRTMKTFIVGIGGVTNGGKTTLANKLLKILPNCSLINQDDYFKPEAEVATDERGFKQFDVLEALEMEAMMSTVHSWITQHNNIVVSSEKPNIVQEKGENTVHFLLVEGFLLYQCKHLDKVFDRRYFLTVPYEECKKRRSTRVYEPPDPPGYFDGHVWPMYIKHKEEMDKVQKEIVFLDGTKPEEEILSLVYSDIIRVDDNFEWFQHLAQHGKYSPLRKTKIRKHCPGVSRQTCFIEESSFPEQKIEGTAERGYHARGNTQEAPLSATDCWQFT
ncbi:nicotinamide riboside kinase 1 isoform X2 [Mixophyes fleayi]|uniref:nicotinamide riboside kinase 1 isoform X2 n=1 Tax=Mixophyes fleayi TaxID=3061075 RepID=UPI003F4DBDC9